MNTTQTFPSPVAHRPGSVLNLLREWLVSLLPQDRASATANAQADAVDLRDLIDEPHGFRCADEYRRQAVERLLAACPYARM